MNDAIETMMKTMLGHQERIADRQEAQAKDITAIKESMMQMVLIEERQANQSETIKQVGSHLNRIADRQHELEIDVSNLKKSEQRSTSRVGVIASAVAALITGAILLIAQAFFNVTHASEAIPAFMQMDEPGVLTICAVPKENQTICVRVPTKAFDSCIVTGSEIVCGQRT